MTRQKQLLQEKCVITSHESASLHIYSSYVGTAEEVLVLVQQKYIRGQKVTMQRDNTCTLAIKLHQP